MLHITATTVSVVNSIIVVEFITYTNVLLMADTGAQCPQGGYRPIACR